MILVEICVRNPLNPHMISERQFSFTTQPVFNQEVTPLTITVMGRAKMIINGTDKIKNSSPASPVIKRYDKLKEIKIEIGSTKKGIFNLRFMWVNMNFAFSKDDVVENRLTISEYLNSKFRKDYSQIINFNSNMNESTTHFLKTDKLSTKLALALVRQVRIVNMDFINVLSQSFDRKVSDFNDIFSLDDTKIQNRILPTHLCLMEYDYSRYFPNYIDYVPEKDFVPNASRKTIFTNLIFIVTNSVQYDNLHYVIESANGKVNLFDLSKNFGLNNENYKSQFKEKFKSLVKEFIYFLKNLISNDSYTAFDIIIFKNMTIDFTKKVEVLNYEILKKTAELLRFELFTNKNFFDSIKEVNSDILTGFKVNKELLLNLEKLDYFLDMKVSESSYKISQQKTLDEENENENSFSETNDILGSTRQRRQRRLRTTSVASLFATPGENLEITGKTQKESHITQSVIAEGDTDKSFSDSIKFMSAESGLSQATKSFDQSKKLLKENNIQINQPVESNSQLSARSRRQRKFTVDSLFGLDNSATVNKKTLNTSLRIAIPEEDEKLQRVSQTGKTGNFNLDISKDDTNDKSDGLGYNKTAKISLDISHEAERIISEHEKVNSLVNPINKNNNNPAIEPHLIEENNVRSEHKSELSNGKISIVTAIQKAKSLEENRIKNDLGEGENTSLLSTEELDRIKRKLKIENIDPSRPHNAFNVNMNLKSNSDRPNKNFKNFVKKLPKRLIRDTSLCEETSAPDCVYPKEYVSYEIFDPADESLYVDKDGEDEKFMDTKMRKDVNEEAQRIQSSRESSIIPNMNETAGKALCEVNNRDINSKNDLSQFKFTNNDDNLLGNSEERLFVAESDHEDEYENELPGENESPRLNIQADSSGNKRSAESATLDLKKRSSYKIRRLRSPVRSDSNSVRSNFDNEDDEDDDEEEIPKFKFST